MSYRVLIVGCGQLGGRHAQALAGLDLCREIVVVDPVAQSLVWGQARVREVGDADPMIRWQWKDTLASVEENFDLVVIATQAAGRVALIKQIAAKFGAKTFLIEKIVAQSIADYEDLIAFAHAQNLKIWVNCKSRAYQVHKRIKSLLPVKEPVIYMASGGNHGLANNGVHHADLFMFFDESPVMESFGSHIDPVVHSSKRIGNMDLSGSLCGATTKGSQFMLSYAAGHMAPDQVNIVSSQGCFTIDHLGRSAYECLPEKDWKWQPMAWQEDILVSFMTRAFARDIFTHQRCDLPDLEQCYPAHEFILKQLQPAFRKLWKADADHCPVT